MFTVVLIVVTAVINKRVVCQTSCITLKWLYCINLFRAITV